MPRLVSWIIDRLWPRTRRMQRNHALRGLAIRRLEERRVLSVGVAVNNNVLEITGLAGTSSVITLSYDAMADEYTIASSANPPVTQSAVGINSVAIDLRDQNDFVTIASADPNAPITIEGGTGDDRLTVLSGDVVLDGAGTGKASLSGALADDFSGFEDLVSEGGMLTVTNGGSLDSYRGGAGNDTVEIQAGGMITDVDLRDGNNVLTVDAGASINTYQGGNDVDTLNIAGTTGNVSTGLGSDVVAIIGTGKINGLFDAGGGTDTLDFSAQTAGVVETVQLGGVAQSSTSVTTMFSVDRVVGDNADDILVAGATNGTFQISGENDGTYLAPGSASFTDFANLRGGVGNEMFVFFDGAFTGSLTGSLDGGGGTNTILNHQSGDWQITGADSGTVNGTVFTNVSILDGGAGIDTFTIDGGSISGSINGGDGNDELVQNAAATFTVNGGDQGSATDVAAFTEIEALTGSDDNDSFEFLAGGSLTGMVSGGLGSDTLSRAGVDTTWTVNGMNSGAVPFAGGFTGVENLTGGADKDDIVIEVGGSLAGDVAGGGGVNSLTDKTGGNWIISGVNQGSSVAGPISNFSDIQSLISTVDGSRFTIQAGASLSVGITGGGAASSITRTSGSNWQITAPNAGTVDGTAFTNIGSAIGSGAADTFTIDPAGSLTNGIDGAGGTDTVIAEGAFDRQTAAGVMLTSVEILTGNGATDTYTADNMGTVEITGAGQGSEGVVSFTGMELVDANGGTVEADGDFVVTGAGAGTVNGTAFQNAMNLTGGAGDNKFTIDGGSIAGLIDGAGGTDTLVQNAVVTFTVTGANAGNATDVNAFANVESLTGSNLDDTFLFQAGGEVDGQVTGGTGNDTLQRNGADATWQITGDGSGTTPFTGGFTEIENLTGGDNADTFEFGANGNLDGNIDAGAGDDVVTLNGAIPANGVGGTIDGGAGSNTLGYVTGANTVVVTGANAGTATSVGGGFSNIQSLQGGGGADDYTINVAGSLTGDIDGGAGSDKVTATGAFTSGSAAGISISNIENLAGAGAMDTYTGAANSPVSITGAGTGSEGGVSFTGMETVAADEVIADADFLIDGADSGTVLGTKFNAANVTGGASKNTFTIDGGSISGQIDGAGDTDTLVQNAATTFNVTVVNAGNATDVNAFVNVESLTGSDQADAFQFQAGGQIAGQITGGDGVDTLSRAAGATTWEVTGAGSGDVPFASGFVEIENLTGGSDADDFVIKAGGSLAGNVDGGGGVNSLTNETGGAWVVDGLNEGTGPGVGGRFANIQSLTGGTAADTFTVTQAGELQGGIDGGGGSNELAYVEGNNTFVVSGANEGDASRIANGFTNIQALQGGTDADDFTIAVGGSLTNGIDGGAGIDTVTATGAFDASTAAGVALLNVKNLVGNGAADTYTGGAASTVTLTGIGAGSEGGVSFTGMETVNADAIAADADYLIDGVNTGEVLNTRFNSQNITGGASQNTFTLTGGSITGVIDGGLNTDTLVQKDAASFTVNGLNAGSETAVNSFVNIESLTGSGNADSFLFAAGGEIDGQITGGAGNDTLERQTGNTTWTVTGDGAGTVPFASGFVEIENLTGGDGVDTFILQAAGKLAGNVLGGDDDDTVTINGSLAGNAIGGVVDGGADSNTLLYVTGNNTINVTALDAGTATGIAGGFSNIQSLVGGDMNDTFTIGAVGSLGGSIDGGGDPEANVLAYVTNNNIIEVTGANSGAASAVTGGFSNIQSLVGGDMNDTFTIAGGGSLGGSIDGGGDPEANVLAYVTNHNAIEVTGANSGTASAITGGFSNIQSLVGGDMNDTFTIAVGGSLGGSIDGGGDPEANVLAYVTNNNAIEVTGANSGAASAITGGFTNIQSLVGGDMNDTFTIAAAGSLGGSIDGGGDPEANVLAYVTNDNDFEVTGANSGTASNVAGGFSNIQSLVGGDMNDTFTIAGGGSLVGSIDGGGDPEANVLAYVTNNNAIEVTGANEGTASGITGGFTNIQSLVGGDMNDTFTIAAAGSLGGSIDGGGDPEANVLAYVTNDNDFEVTGANEGTASGIAGGFTNIQSLTGGDMDDTFTIAAAGSLGGSIDGGGDPEANLLIYVTNDNNVQINGANAGTASGLGGGFSNIQSLTGGDMADVFTFGALGSLGGSIDGGGNPEANVLAYVTNNNSVQVTGANEGTASGIAGGFTNIQSLVGGDMNDTFTIGAAGSLGGSIDGGGDPEANVLAYVTNNNDFEVTGANAGTATNIAGGFTNIQSLTGGDMNDAFTIAAAGSLRGSIDGGGDPEANVLTYVTNNNNIQVTGANAGTASKIGNGFTNIQSLVGGDMNDTFTIGGAGSLAGSIDGGGNPEANVLAYVTNDNSFEVTGANAGTASGITGGFTNIQSLVGGDMDDTFTIAAGGTLDGSVDGGGDPEANLLTYVTNNNNFEITGANAGTASGIAGGFTNIQSLTGGDMNDVFTVAAAGSLVGSIDGGGDPEANVLAYVTGNNTFEVTGANSGTADRITNGFTNIQSLTGGDGNDTFTVSTGSLAGSVDGGAGANSLNVLAPGVDWVFTGVGAGTVDGIGAGFQRIRNVAAGVGANTFTFNGGSIAGSLVDPGGQTVIDGPTVAATGSVDIAGEVRIENAVGVTTTGDQLYQKAATINSPADTTTFSGVNIRFLETLDSTGGAGVEALSFNATGDVSVAGVIGGTQSFASLDIMANGDTTLNGADVTGIVKVDSNNVEFASGTVAGGNLDVDADNAIDVNNNSQLTSTGGATFNAGSDFTMTPDTLVNADDALSIVAGSNITASQIVSGVSVNLEATDGQISGAADAQINVEAPAASLTAAKGIGSNTPLRTHLGTLAAKNDGANPSGNIRIVNTRDDLTIGMVGAVTGVTQEADGDIQITSTEKMTVENSIALNANGGLTLNSTGDYEQIAGADLSILNTGNISVDSQAALTIAGNVTANDGSVMLNSNGAMNVSGDTISTAGGTRYTSGDLLDVSGDITTTGGDTNLQSQAATTISGMLMTTGNTGVEAINGAIQQTGGSVVTVGGTTTFKTSNDQNIVINGVVENQESGGGALGNIELTANGNLMINGAGARVNIAGEGQQVIASAGEEGGPKRDVTITGGAIVGSGRSLIGTAEWQEGGGVVTVEPTTAPNVLSGGRASIRITINDPVATNAQIGIDWRDRVSAGQSFIVYPRVTNTNGGGVGDVRLGGNGTAVAGGPPTSYDGVIQHELSYTYRQGNPDRANPFADIPIDIIIRPAANPVDGGRLGIEPGNIEAFTQAINPANGILLIENGAIVEFNVSNLALTVPTQGLFQPLEIPGNEITLAPVRPPQLQVVVASPTTSQAETALEIDVVAVAEFGAESTRAVLFFTIVNPDGTESDPYELDLELLKGDRLEELFKTFPSNIYRIQYKAAGAERAEVLFTFRVFNGVIVSDTPITTTEPATTVPPSQPADADNAAAIENEAEAATEASAVDEAPAEDNATAEFVPAASSEEQAEDTTAEQAAAGIAPKQGLAVGLAIAVTTSRIRARQRKDEAQLDGNTSGKPSSLRSAARTARRIKKRISGLLSK